LQLLVAERRGLAAVEDLEADRAGLPFHQAAILVRLRQRDVAPVRVLQLGIAVADDRILRELKEVAAEEAEAVLDGDLYDAERGHHADHREPADGHA